MPAERLGILLLSGSHERAHYAFMVATSAAALGRTVVLFATNGGCRALLEDWSTLDPAGRDGALVAAGVAGFATLRQAAVELGIRMLACEAGLRAEGLHTPRLFEGVAVSGLATFLAETSGGQLVSL